MRTIDQEAKEVTRMAQDPPADPPLTREERYQRRRSQIEADTTLDPRRAALYLDRELWNASHMAAELGWVVPTVYQFRSRTASGPSPHPSVLPPPDVTIGQTPWWEAGGIRLWAVLRRTHLMNSTTGKLTKTNMRHGRARTNRPILSRESRQRRDDD